MDDDLKVLVSIVGGAFGLLVAIVGLIVFAANWSTHHACQTYAAEMQTTYRYGIVDGCRIQQGDAYIPLENLREFRHDPD